MLTLCTISELETVTSTEMGKRKNSRSTVLLQHPRFQHQNRENVFVLKALAIDKQKRSDQ